MRGLLRIRPGGDPACLVTVRLGQGDRQVVSSATDLEGAFRLASVPPGLPFEVRASGQGFASTRFEGSALERGEDRDLGVLWIDPTVAVTVTVRTLDGDLPVEGARVEVSRVPPVRSGSDLWGRMRTLGRSPEPAFRATTGTDGTVRLPGVPAGTWCVVASKKGLVREGWIDPRRGQGDIEIRGGETEVELTLRLAGGLPLTGRVLDAAGRPIADAVVVTGFPVLWNPPALFSRARTDGAGRFAFDDLRSGELLLLVSRDGVSLTQGPRVRLPFPGEVDIVLRTGTLAGTVYDADSGRPVPGAAVVAGGVGRAEALADAEGRYAIDSLPPCTVTLLLAEKEGWLPADTSDVAGLLLRRQPRVPWIQGRTRLEIPLRAGETVVHDLLLRRGARLSGTVSGPDGPVPWARVTVVSDSAREGPAIPVTTTDGAGRFEFPAAPEGPVLLVAEKEGWCQPGLPPGKAWEESLRTGVPSTPHRLEIPRTGSVAHDIVLSRGLSIEGRVESMDGAPIPGAVALASQTTCGYHESRALSAEDGTFRIAGLTPGVRALLWAEKDGWYAADGSRPVDLPAEGPLPAPSLRLRRAARVQGVLTAASGRPLQGATVWVSVVTGRRDESGRSVEEATSRLPLRSDGSYEAPVAATAEGEFTVIATAPGFAEARSKPVKVEGGQEVYVVDLTMAESHRIQGRVVAKGTNAGIAGARVFLGHRPDMTFAMTDRDGRFAVEDLDARYGTFGGGKGMYLVSADAEGFRRGQVQVGIGSHEAVVVELQQAGD